MAPSAPVRTTISPNASGVFSRPSAGLIGQYLDRPWWRVIFGAALGITIYWPVVVLAAAVDARGASGWDLDETAYWIVLPTIAAWALWGLSRVVRDERYVSEDEQ